MHYARASVSRRHVYCIAKCVLRRIPGPPWFILRAFGGRGRVCNTIDVGLIALDCQPLEYPPGERDCTYVYEYCPLSLRCAVVCNKVRSCAKRALMQGTRWPKRPGKRPCV